MRVALLTTLVLAVLSTSTSSYATTANELLASCEEFLRTPQQGGQGIRVPPSAFEC
jgi:hypothetical protein